MCCRAEALQSIVQLMGEENIFSYYRNTFKTNRIDWDLAKARQVLHTWQRACVQVRSCVCMRV